MGKKRTIEMGSLTSDDLDKVVGRMVFEMFVFEDKDGHLRLAFGGVMKPHQRIMLANTVCDRLEDIGIVKVKEGQPGKEAVS